MTLREVILRSDLAWAPPPGHLAFSNVTFPFKCYISNVTRFEGPEFSFTVAYGAESTLLVDGGEKPKMHF